MADKSLPLILVSASDLSNASCFISDLIDNEVVEDVNRKHNSKVWQITNKYYQVDVEVCPAVDSELMNPTLDFEAHIIYISNDEVDWILDPRHSIKYEMTISRYPDTTVEVVSGYTDREGAERVAEERRARAGGAERAHVRLLASDGERAEPALAAWARRRRYEHVPLREPAPAAPPGPFRETYGVERVRAALHAHTWRGLRRRERAPAEPAERDAERAEAFAEALGALGAARGAAGSLADGERRLRAERLVAAFCRALGAEPPAV